MSKLLGLSGMRGRDHFKSLAGSGLGAGKAMPITTRMSADMVSSGSFANLKLTAEKLVKEQASAKTDLQLATSKLKKLIEDIHMLEEKLQNAYNENAKLKVKQKEDEKLWKGLESKFSSTKTLCDQLTETLQHLAGVVQDAEKDKASFEDRRSVTSVVIDNLQDNMKALSLRLESSEEAVRNCKKELNEIGIEKEKMENYFRVEQSKSISVIEEKDAMIKEFEATVVANGLAVENLKSKLEELHLESRLKEDELEDLRNVKKNLEKERSDLVSRNSNFAKQLDTSLQEIKNLNEFVNEMVVKFTNLDSQSLAFAEKIVQLNSLFDAGFEMMREKGELAARHAQRKFDKLQDQYSSVTSEKNALELANKDLKDIVSALQKEQEHAMVQHAEESRLAEDRIRKLESEAELLLSKKMEMEVLISKLQENVVALSENSKLSENEMQNLLVKLSDMETENKDHIGKLQSDMQKKEDEIHLLRKEIDKYTETVESQEKHVAEINNKLEEKDKLLQELQDRQKQLEAEREKIQASLLAAESNLAEAKKQHDQMLESKQLELSRHLKELSQKNDQAISDIRRKYDVEKLESINLEKEKAEKIVGEMERNCELKLLECREESNQNLKRVQEEHAALVCHIQQEHSKKETSLVSSHNEELKRVRLQYENELREKTSSMRNEHEAQLRSLRVELEDECRRLQEELDMLKSKEEKQRALLQLQWKVMGNNPEEEEVTSKKKHSGSLTKRNQSDSCKRGQLAPVRAESKDVDAHYLEGSQTPVSNLLRKVEKVNTGSVISMPKHSRKVTHHEYEVETTNGRTITKRRKTKSTVMFDDPSKNKKKRTPKVKTPREVIRSIKGGGHPKTAYIGDLFSEGSLNPYADDPYAFG
ncbi:PREDICTED: synaptonemal complex protein 1-like [Nicotiana attenuata]|uniref:Synaptonemal complex protein 1 n=1 Tax=Nicotiana attenuata TaxID=49451 RepID=A0A1J6IUB7_NICAT|nr:PREDICTED: synaptonemal complex protein 1-like [Nicotiana attenuata]OIT08438.1 synaptonemal complex protein 1 [Nicotiana attenuata]